MKLNKLIISVAATFLLSIMPVMSQKKIVIDDRAQFLTEPVESALANRLRSDSVELTSVIDNKKRCEYWFATLTRKGSDIYLSVLDCNDKVAGTRNLGTIINSAADSEKALLIYFAVSEITKNPNAGIEEPPGTITQSLPPAEALNPQQVIPLQTNDPGQHKSRYFFAPSSYTLNKGELYYNTLYFLIHDVQYGISDQFSIGMGTTIIGFPFYVTPKFTMPVNEKSALSLGDILIIGTYNVRFTGNLTYLTYTRGNANNNFTVGGGLLLVGGRDISDEIAAPVFNFSALVRISDHIYFITESYASFFNKMQTAYYNDYNTGVYYEEEFSQDMFLMYNLLGFRFTNKRNDVRCWQIGLSFITAAASEIPAKYQNPNYWWTEAPAGSSFFPIPVIGYARKFSTKY